MDDESITFIHSSKKTSSLDGINILVVDDDATCLTIVAAILKKFKYQVVTVNHPNDALSTLRSRCFSFDLVVADVHMPDMNGFQLQQTIAKEFNNLPVVLMSADDTENTAIRGLETGAAFFILKPVMADDLRDLWQFAAVRRNAGQGAVETNTNMTIVPHPAEDQHKRSSTFSDESTMKANSDASGDSVISKRDASKGKSPRKESSYEDKNGENLNLSSPSNSPQKRPKVIWTNSLHNRFLEAIRSIGLDRAVPKKILEVMNVPGLTRENVASHLQKYRIFLRRVSDASYKIQYTTDKGGSSRSIRPTFDFTKPSPQSAARPDMLSSTPCFPDPGRLQFPGRPAFSSSEGSSSSNLVSQSSGFGQSRLLGANKRNMLRANVGNSALLTQKNRHHFMMNSFLPGGSIQGQPSSLSLARMNPCPNFETSPAIGTLGSIINLPTPSMASSSVSKLQTINSTTTPCLDEAPLMCPVGVNSNPSFGIPSMLEDICNASSVPLNHVEHPYVGYSLSDIKHFTESGQVMGELTKGDQTLDFSGDADRFLINNNSVLSFEGMNNADFGTCSSSFAPDNRGEELLSNVIQDYQISMCSGPFLGDHHGNNQSDQQQPFTPFNLSEFDILPNQHTPLEASDNRLDINFTEQANIQNQPQSESCEHIASSNFYSGGASLWNNLIPSSSQPRNKQHQQQFNQSLVDFQAFDNAPPLLINKTTSAPPVIQGNKGADNSMAFGSFTHQTNNVATLHAMNPPPEQRDDDDFLESLFAPFIEDQNFEGL